MASAWTPLASSPESRLVNHAMAFDPGLTFERLRHNIYAEVGLPAWSVSGMALVLVGFIQHIEALRSESLGQLLCDDIGDSHVAPLRRGQSNGQCLKSCSCTKIKS